MDVRFPNSALLKALQSAQSGSGSRATNSTSQATGALDFAQALGSALKSVSRTQQEATQLSQQFELENPNVTLEQTMIAMQKAQIAFQGTLHVRNKLVSAYTEIMNMNV
ncbi:MAG TPA: flagellar hook-basal body complex protein FliE [Burkholderiaceae bacterium]|nr:flagellar hook-basal body complex protein FliE [Burkholderiaceae bacterium]